MRFKFWQKNEDINNHNIAFSQADLDNALICLLINKGVITWDELVNTVKDRKGIIHES
jgi:hypothetical protein